MIKFRVKLKGVRKGEQKTLTELQQVLRGAMTIMESLAVQKAPVDIGTLRQNITLFPQILSDKYFLVSKMPYSEHMEYGSRPMYVPIKPLQEWAKRKVGEPDFGYYVQSKIARVGITAQPFMRPALHEVRAIHLDNIAKAKFK